MKRLAACCLLALATLLPRPTSADPLSLDPYEQEKDRATRQSEKKQAILSPPDDSRSRNQIPEPPRYAGHFWEFVNNPDRYPSIFFSESAVEVVDGHVSTVQNGVGKNHGQAFFNDVANISGILPLADWFTWTLTGGISLNEFHSDQTVEFNGTANDNSIGTYSTNLRFFLVGTHPFGINDKNPDRWASIGITGGGTTSMQYQVTNNASGLNGNLNQPVNTQTWRVDLDCRLPLADWYTIIPDVFGLYSQSQSPAVPTGLHTGLSATVAHTRSLGGTLEQRFYFVGKNLIADDRGLNPDRWTSFYLILGGQSALSGDSSFTTVDGISAARGNTTKTLNAAFGFRLPMTSHSTLRLEADMNYTDSFLPEITNPNTNPFFTGTASSRTRQTQLGGLAALRYYVF